MEGKQIISEEFSEFAKYCEQEISPAIVELRDNIQSEKNRRHLQKLLYTSVVNRFDKVLDDILTKLAIQEGTSIYENILSLLKNETINKGELYEMLRSHDIKSYVDQELRKKATSDYVSKRHDEKLKYILVDCRFHEKTELRGDRVNWNNGDILERIAKRQDIPLSILGYSSYLYARRNAIVHGANKEKYMKRDRDAILKYHGAVLPETFKITLAGVNNAINFYKSLSEKVSVR